MLSGRYLSSLDHQYGGYLVSGTHRYDDLRVGGLYSGSHAPVLVDLDHGPHRLADRTLGGYLCPALPPYPHIDVETLVTSRERSRGLLKSLLTPEQWVEFERVGKVTEQIDGCDFTLTPGGMIEARKPRLVGSVTERWCVTPDPYADANDYMPSEDKLIGQLLHLRAGPDKLRAKANVWGGSECPHGIIRPYELSLVDRPAHRNAPIFARRLQRLFSRRRHD